MASLRTSRCRPGRRCNGTHPLARCRHITRACPHHPLSGRGCRRRRRARHRFIQRNRCGTSAQHEHRRNRQERPPSLPQAYPPPHPCSRHAHDSSHLSKAGVLIRQKVLPSPSGPPADTPRHDTCRKTRDTPPGRQTDFLPFSITKALHHLRQTHQALLIANKTMNSHSQR